MPIQDRTRGYDCATERDTWRLFYGNRDREKASDRKRNHQRIADKEYRKFFHPETGIDPADLPDLFLLFAEGIEQGRYAFNTGNPMLRYVAQFHPDALRFLAKYGTLQEPYLHPQKPYWQPHPDQNCNEIAYTYLWLSEKPTGHRAAEMWYAEGLIIGPISPVMLHAWNVFPEWPNCAFDGDLYASGRWLKYFGITLNRTEHAAANRCIFPHSSKFTLLFDQSRWNADLAAYLTDLHEQRLRTARQ